MNKSRTTTQTKKEIKHKSEKGVIVKGGKVIKKKNSGLYRKLYNHFIENEEPDFKEAMGYGKEEIDAIGYRKFVDANDWRSVEDVSKWRTDMAHVIPCPHCKKEFAILEVELGLCHNCYPLFDIERFSAECAQAKEKNPNLAMAEIAALFVYDENIRNAYLK